MIKDDSHKSVGESFKLSHNLHALTRELIDII